MSQPVTAPLPLLDTPPQHLVLHPGDVACASRGDTLETLLGSCVAVVLTDPRRTVGAMCHIVHAGGQVHEHTSWSTPALARMVQLLQARAINARLCHAFVYGGGNMFPGCYDGGHVGQANTARVLQALADEGISVAAQDVGGPLYRRIRWTVGPALPEVNAVALPN